MKRDYETIKLEKMMLYFQNVIASSNGLIEESEGEGDSGDFKDLFG